MRRHSPLLAFALVLAGAVALAQDSELTRMEDQFVRVADQVSPSVVTVISKFKLESDETDLEEEGTEKDAPQAAKPEWETTFSGVIFDAQGRIVTVASAVTGATGIRVTLHDGRVIPARVIGSDAKSNLAVIQIDAEGLRPIQFAVGENPRVGSWVIAVGNPFGLSGSVTYGIVSGVHRTIGGGDRVFSDMIQTTAPVNPGDAGGLVANLRGEMVGLTSSTFQRATAIGDMRETMKRMAREFDFSGLWQEFMRNSKKSPVGEEDNPAELLKPWIERFKRNLPHAGGPSPDAGGGALYGRGQDQLIGAEGINFLVPAARVRDIAARLIEKGTVQRAFLGLQVSPIDPSLRSQLGLDAQQGVLVVGVVAESPAGQAGLQTHDVLLDFGDRPIRGLADLESAMIDHAPGSQIEIKLFRKGKQTTVSVLLGKRE